VLPVCGVKVLMSGLRTGRWAPLDPSGVSLSRRSTLPATVAARPHRFFGTTTVRVSKAIGAPKRYVYEWCTDYRPSDSRFSRARPRPRYRVIHVSPRRVLRIRITGQGRSDPAIAVDVVRLDPPRSWRTDQIDESDWMSLDYRLAPIGPRRTRLTLHVTERWLTRDHPTSAELRARVSAVWDRYAAAIEADFRAGRPARG
jgi:hypothetical protein